MHWMILGCGLWERLPAYHLIGLDSTHRSEEIKQVTPTAWCEAVVSFSFLPPHVQRVECLSVWCVFLFSLCLTYFLLADRMGETQTTPP